MKLEWTRLAGAILLLVGTVLFWLIGDFLVEGVRDRNNGAGDAFVLLAGLTLLGLALLLGGRRVANAFTLEFKRKRDLWIVLGFIGSIIAALLAVSFWPGPYEDTAAAATDADTPGNLYDPATARDPRLVAQGRLDAVRRRGRQGAASGSAAKRAMNVPVAIGSGAAAHCACTRFLSPRESGPVCQEIVMRKFILAAGLSAAAALIPVSGASAQYYGQGYGYNRGNHYGQNDVRREIRECRRELRRADSRREYRRELRECEREIARARYQNRHGYGYNDRYRSRDRYGDYDRRRRDW